MRIEREDGTMVGPVWAVATREEAQTLLDALVFYFCEDGTGILNTIAQSAPPEPDPRWHCHIGGSAYELTIAIEADSPIVAE